MTDVSHEVAVGYKPVAASFIIKICYPDGTNEGFAAERWRTRYADAVYLDVHEVGRPGSASYRLEPGTTAYVMNADGLTIEQIRGRRRGGEGAK